jgi:hypothetical protein
MRTILAGVAAVTILVAGPVEAKKEPQISGLALQQIQSRDYEVGKDVSFPSVMTVLQDAGYRIQEADKDTGLIVGTASTKSATTYNIFWGLGKKKKTPVVSAFVEDRGRGSRVRLNFVLSTTKSRIYGVGSADEEPINDPAIYRDAFEKIEKEIFVRQALVAPAPKPANAMPQPTQAAASSKIEPSQSPSSAPNTTGLTPNPADMPSALKMDPKPQ